jgi:hypothetical protein
MGFHEMLYLSIFRKYVEIKFRSNLVRIAVVYLNTVHISDNNSLISS